MAWPDRIVYHVKAAVPWAYDLMAAGNAALTLTLHGRRIRRALSDAVLSGTVFGEPAVIRPIGTGDLDRLDALISAMPEEHLKFFHPHGLDRDSLRKVLKARSILTFGLFQRDELVAYALLKLFATKRAYLGRVVAPAMAGSGIGRFLNRYLYWHGYKLGFAVCGTVSKDNLASLRSHAAVRPYKFVAILPNDFRLMELSIIEEDANPPELRLERTPKSSVRSRG